ncbi:hypothetical protein BCR35DRAFT_307254 [Leucosporidium creatinivorum]|uniref:Uncharacterized protein n=1 Tax=Leucosporidium creatinivorum TaxID=106004 RepID=A0A1Y2EQX3_9BASI|nr:hypothetical protein BCR35DRAFT_307254 [Leucosporidium creatinivorum]
MSSSVSAASELLYALQHGSPLPQALAAQLQGAAAASSPPVIYDFVPPLPPRAARPAASPTVVEASPAPLVVDSPPAEEQATTHRCSQCKQDRPLDEFPTRLTTLQPFLVCKSHAWYWTPAKRELHWAPEGISTMETVCREVGEVVSEQRTAGSWIVRGTAEDRNAIVTRVASVQNWVALPVAMRKSRASGPAPPPPHHYQLKTRGINAQAPTWRLVVTFHESQRKHVVAFKKDVGRKPGTWAKSSVAKTEEQAPTETSEQPQEEHESTSDPPRNQAVQQQQQQPHPQPQEGRRTGINPQHPAPRVDPTPPLQQPVQGQTDANAEASSSGHSSSSGSHRRSSSVTTSDHPPPKRTRRVEPSLLCLSPSLSRHSPLYSRSSSHTPRARPSTPLIAPRAAFAQLPSSNTRSTNDSSSDPPTSSSTPFYSSTFAPPPPTHNPPHRASSTRTPIQPLTLDELLASPYTDPPTIPLRQRTMQLNAAAYYAATSAARARSTSEGASSAGGGSANAGREREGQRGRAEPSSDIATMFDDGDVESEEEAMATDGGEEEESEEEDDDGDGGDWLTGLVKGELIGLGQASQEEIDELESGGEESGGEE